MRTRSGLAIVQNFALALPICLALTLPAFADEDACERRIVVTGHAEASYAPDYIALTLASESKAASVAGAIEASTKALAEIGALARDLGLQASDVRTSSVVLEEATRTVSRTLGADLREPDGFRVNNRVSLRLADRSRAGELVRRILDKGGLRIDSVELGLDDPGKAEAALLVAAGKDARAQATALAEAAGTKAGAVCNLKAGSVQKSPPLPRSGDGSGKSDKYSSDPDYRYSDKGGKSALSVPLVSGTIDLALDVAAEFAAQP